MKPNKIVKTFKKSILFAGILTMIFQGCQSSKKVAADCQRLRNTQWNLESIYSEPIIRDSLPSIPFIVFFNDQKFSGNLSCNTYFGYYYNKKKKLDLEFQGSTKMLCPQMQLEKKFLSAIKKEITTFTITDHNELILYADKEEILRFSHAGNFKKTIE